MEKFEGTEADRPSWMPVSMGFHFAAGHNIIHASSCAISYEQDIAASAGMSYRRIDVDPSMNSTLGTSKEWFKFPVRRECGTRFLAGQTKCTKT